MLLRDRRYDNLLQEMQRGFNDLTKTMEEMNNRLSIMEREESLRGAGALLDPFIQDMPVLGSEELQSRNNATYTRASNPRWPPNKTYVIGCRHSMVPFHLDHGVLSDTFRPHQRILFMELSDELLIETDQGERLDGVYISDPEVGNMKPGEAGSYTKERMPACHDVVIARITGTEKHQEPELTLKDASDYRLAQDVEYPSFRAVGRGLGHAITSDRNMKCNVYLVDGKRRTTIEMGSGERRTRR